MAIFMLACALGHTDFEGAWRDGTDSRGRVGIFVRIYYKGPKTIKYCNFVCAPINSVGDYEACTLTGKIEVRLRITGPIQSSPYFQEYKFDNLWKNLNISDIVQSDVDVQYMDGSMETFSEEKMAKYLPQAQQEMNETKNRDGVYHFLFYIGCVIFMLLFLRGCAWVMENI